MKTLNEQLSTYAEYHRDPRNIQTHLVGVPMIAFAVEVLLSRPVFEVAGLPMSPLWPVLLLVAAFYFRLDLRFGLTMSLLLFGGAVGAQAVAAQSTAMWLGVGVGSFVVGWVIQFVGHYFEGRKPAFVDDLVGLLLGPLFVTAEVGFMLGLRKEVQSAIEAKAGPVRLSPNKSRA